MPEAIVDLLESVEIHQGQAQAARVPAHTHEFVADALG